MIWRKKLLSLGVSAVAEGALAVGFGLVGVGELMHSILCAQIKKAHR
jgi:hypothetical protein